MSKKTLKPAKASTVSPPSRLAISAPPPQSPPDATHAQHKEAFDALLDLTAKPRTKIDK